MSNTLLLFYSLSISLTHIVNSEEGIYSDKVCFGTTRKDDPKEWFCNEYPEFKCDSLQKVLEDGNVTYYRAVLDQSKRTRALSKDTEDSIVHTHNHSKNFVLFQQEIAYERVSKTNDAEWSNLWHLNDNISPSLKISEAWELGYTGSGITVAIVDDGLQRDHPDLQANVNTTIGRDVIDGDPDPDPVDPDRYNHGTRVSGLVAAENNNNVCIVGVAYQSTLVGIRLISSSLVTDSQEAEALGWQLNEIDIYINSWGPPDGYGFFGPGPVTKNALQNGVSNGRGGKGVIFTWASGNGNTNDNCNGDGYVNSIYTIAISSVQQGQNAWYSEVCAAAMAATYGGSKKDRHLTTTDTRSGCTSEDVEGTSFSTPIAAGIIALALQANPNLTWRDVQHILVLTSSKSGFEDTYSSWQINGAGKEFSQVLGFGFMDAEAFVTQAVNWTTSVPIQHSCKTSTFTGPWATSGSLYSTDNRTIQNSDCSTISYLEHVTIDIDFSYDAKRGLTELYLISQAGTESHLLHSRYDDADRYSSAGSLSWTFMSVHFWGENPIGLWTLKFKSHLGLSIVTVNSWSLTFYGTTTNPVPDSALCDFSPCQNNRTCVRNQYSYSCQCIGNASCESTTTNSNDENPCACQKNGTCSRRKRSIKCASTGTLSSDDNNNESSNTPPIIIGVVVSFAVILIILIMAIKVQINKRKGKIGP